MHFYRVVASSFLGTATLPSASVGGEVVTALLVGFGIMALLNAIAPSD